MLYSEDGQSLRLCALPWAGRRTRVPARPAPGAQARHERSRTPARQASEVPKVKQVMLIRR
jgi:hypothetical protein